MSTKEKYGQDTFQNKVSRYYGQALKTESKSVILAGQRDNLLQTALSQSRLLMVQMRTFLQSGLDERRGFVTLFMCLLNMREKKSGKAKDCIGPRHQLEHYYLKGYQVSQAAGFLNLPISSRQAGGNSNNIVLCSLLPTENSTVSRA